MIDPRVSHRSTYPSPTPTFDQPIDGSRTPADEQGPSCADGHVANRAPARSRYEVWHPHVSVPSRHVRQISRAVPGHRLQLLDVLRPASDWLAYYRSMSDELANPVVVDFPLRDDWWVAVNSPADRFPSHGTDLLGQRYAFDFIRTDLRSRLHYHRASWLRTLIVGVPTRECYAWGRPVHSVFDATIVAAVDGVPERGRIHPIREAVRAIWNGLTFTPDRLPAILGNHVVARHGDLVAVYAHLAPGSVIVVSGQAVRAGDRIGSVGHTGNSTTPISTSSSSRRPTT